jgi:DnaJ-class molecular chaperone
MKMTYTEDMLKKCPACKGKGMKDGKITTVKCPICKGSGRVVNI